MHALLSCMYILVKAPCEYTTGFLERGCGREADKARGVAECLIRLRDNMAFMVLSVPLIRPCIVLQILVIVFLITGHFPIVPLHLEWGDAVGTHMHHATYNLI